MSATVRYLSAEDVKRLMPPMPEVIDFNRGLHERLESHGEGLLAAVFGLKLALIVQKVGAQGDRDRQSLARLNGWYGDIHCLEESIDR